ncbi:DNA-3-methyladenine glycosylase II [Sarracenia purpurea var. burkii]
MGEQTQIQIETQLQSQPHPSQPHHVPTTSQPQPSPVILPANDLSQNTYNSSKIPVRPHKLRKLSAAAASVVSAVDTTDDNSPQVIDADSSQALVVSKGSTAATTKNRRRNFSQPARVLGSVIKPLSADGEIDLALRHLRTSDPLLVNLIDSLPRPAFDSHQPPFLALTKNILYQQLAYKAGTSIYTRFVELCGGKDAVRPDAVLALSTQQLRQIGVSGRKAVYLFDLANKYKSGILSDDLIVGMDDKSLFTMLSMVKGIGSWSVHMFMINSLHRPDVLPVSDMGVRKGVQVLYCLEELPRPSQMEQLCEKWRPYRSVGSWYMWRLVEGKGNPQSGAAVALEGIMPLQQQMVQKDEIQQQQHQLQLLEPISGTPSFGACIWGQ